MRSEPTNNSATIMSQRETHDAIMEEGNSISELLESATVARAKLLARKGKLKQAELLLVPLSKKQEPQANVLDLLARVYAQQGKVAEARSIWLGLLRTNTSDEHILQALIDCIYIENLGPRQFSLMRLLPWFVILLTVGLISYLLALCVLHGI